MVSHDGALGRRKSWKMPPGWTAKSLLRQTTRQPSSLRNRCGRRNVSDTTLSEVQRIRQSGVVRLCLRLQFRIELVRRLRLMVILTRYCRAGSDGFLKTFTPHMRCGRRATAYVGSEKQEVSSLQTPPLGDPDLPVPQQTAETPPQTAKCRRSISENRSNGCWRYRLPHHHASSADRGTP